jgi:hypothetical protein
VQRRDRLIRRLFVVDWHRPPTTRLFVKLGLALTLLWGVTFGLIDSDLLTIGNWLYALLAGLLFVLVFLGVRRLDRWARRRVGDSA